MRSLELGLGAVGPEDSPVPASAAQECRMLKPAAVAFPVGFCTTWGALDDSPLPFRDLVNLVEIYFYGMVLLGVALVAMRFYFNLRHVTAILRSTGPG